MAVETLIEYIIAVLGVGAVAIGSYELYENDDLMDEVVTQYLLYEKTHEMVISPDGTIVQGGISGWYLPNPEDVSQEERDKLGLSPGFTKQDYLYALYDYWDYTKKNGGGSKNFKNKDDNDSKLNNILLTGASATGILATLKNYYTYLTNGESDSELINSLINDTVTPVYTGNIDTSIPYIVSISYKEFYSPYGDNDYNVGIEKYTSPAGYLPYGSYSGGSYSFGYGKDGSVYGSFSITLYDKTYISCNVPIFNNSKSIIKYLQTGDDTGCINKVKPKITWAQKNAMAQKLPSILSALSTLANYEVLPSTSLKLFIDSMLENKTLTDTDILTNPQTQEETAKKTMEETVNKNKVETPTETEPKPQPMPAPEYPTPEKITIEDIDATRDWRLVFPFCIPFDMIDLFKVLAAEPKAPYWEIPLRVESFGFEYTFVIDFEQFDSLAEIFRLCETIAFILGLALVTGKVIKW